MFIDLTQRLSCDPPDLPSCDTIIQACAALPRRKKGFRLPGSNADSTTPRFWVKYDPYIEASAAPTQNHVASIINADAPATPGGRGTTLRIPLVYLVFFSPRTEYRYIVGVQTDSLNLLGLLSSFLLLAR